jgi:CrcB protein
MTNPWTMSLLVGVGGFAGSVARYGLSLAAQRFSVGWPLGTLAANMLGCLVIGVLTGLSNRGESLSPAVRLMLAAGFCGGFTTMSSMVYETVEMLRASEYLHATGYAAGTVVLSMGAFVAGVMAVSMLVRAGGGAWS